jgi:methionyl-tRNA formyltransferase
VPAALPPAVYASGQPLRVVLYARDTSAKVAQMVDGWSSWGFRPAAVVIETPPIPPAARRLIDRVREDGLRVLARRIPLLRDMMRHRLFETRPPGRSPGVTGDAHLPDVEAFCRARRIPVTRVGRLDTPAAIASVTALRPDLAIHAGAGILRAPLLTIPRLGTLNAHMGILPRYRGVNVAEWARFGGGPVGCTVHLIDAGIDTGHILCVREISPDSATSIAALRAAVDREQIRALGQVVRWIVEAGTLPPRRAQHEHEGQQFFRMHPDLATVLERELAPGASRGRAGVNAPSVPVVRSADAVAV